MDWQDVKVLVTGGAGFIGSHLVEMLLGLGCEVTVADNFSRGSLENIQSFADRITLYEVDLTRREACLSVTKDMERVFHLAASVGGIQFILKENVGGLTPSLLMNTHMLEAARQNDVARFLFASSACVYRDREAGLNQFKEEDAYPANPLSTYGWAKLLGEIQCRAYYDDYGIRSSVARIFNAYGERENLDPRWSHVIPSLIRKAVLYPREGFTLFGDGQQQRAFLYVKDCVKGLILCMEKASNAEPVNLGSEEVVSIKELAQKIITISDKNIELEYNLSGPQGTNKYCSDPERMRNVLEWLPPTELNEGLEKVYAWIEKQLADRTHL